MGWEEVVDRGRIKKDKVDGAVKGLVRGKGVNEQEERNVEQNDG